MTTMRECVEELSVKIGARPIGTDEEQQAAFFIEDTMKAETNFDVELQEFDAVKSPELARVIPAAITFFACIFALIMSEIPAISFLLALVGAALFVTNELGIFSIASFFGKAPSQNVVATHLPANGEVAGRKKIVILTNYDSEKVRAEEATGIFSHLGKLKLFELGASVLTFLATLIMFLAGANMFVTVLLVLGLIGSALPVFAFILHSGGKYNEGANNNAASVAVMLEVAKRISAGVYTPAGEVPIIHGASEAEALGAIPEGVSVRWAKDEKPKIDPSSPVASMLFDKSRVEGGAPAPAVAEAEAEKPAPAPAPAPSPALSPASDNYSQSAQAPVVQDVAQQFSQASASYQEQNFEPEPEVQPAQQTRVDSSAPDWFTRGRAKAGDKGNTNAANVRRSTFGDAITNAENRVHEREAQEFQADSNILQKKLQAIHDQIEAASANATKDVEKDAKVAEKVLDNEQKAETKTETKPEPKKQQDQKGVTGFLEKETASATFEETKAQEPVKPQREVANVPEVPALKPLEPEYGVEVDPEEFLDKGKTEPMNRVDANEVPAINDAPVAESAPEPAENAPQRNIELPSLTGALDSKRINERLEEQKQQANEQHQEQVQTQLNFNLPSLSSDASQDRAARDENKAVSKVSAFGVGEATGVFEPITDEDLIRANEGEDDLYVYDADDTALQQATTDSGAVAGPGYVDIPDTHTESIFGKLFHKKDKGDDASFADTIGVDENYEARRVGKDRGDWSSFNNDAWDDDDWNGGAVVTGEGDLDINERDAIYNFATNDIAAEVWCVALGAECSNHSGLANFLQVNGLDLKGAKFVTLDALGAGDLTVVESEGVIKPQAVQTRMKRMARDAAKSLGISIGSEKMLWKETTSSALGAKGNKYVHIAGFEAGRPALSSSMKDTAENVYDDVLQTSADYLMELVRTL